MTLENRILALIAVGSSVSANCLPCLEYNVNKALECGADSQQIAEAIEIGKKVRQGARIKMDRYVSSLDNIAPGFPKEESGCHCG